MQADSDMPHTATITSRYLIELSLRRRVRVWPAVPLSVFGGAEMLWSVRLPAHNLVTLIVHPLRQL